MSSDDEDVHLQCYGYFQDRIVGIQYYEGEVNRNEMVVLEREPENPYDRWAIRVDNVRGEKVGHLPRKLVCHLSPLVDSGMVGVEGLVPRGNNNVYHMPVHLYVFGDPCNKQTVAARLAAAGCQLVDPATAAAAAGRSRVSAVGSPGSPSGSKGWGGGGAASTQLLTSQEMEASIDRLFQDLGQDVSEEMLDPHPEITTPLYPHQLQALAWMVRRENSNCLPPLWQPYLKAGGGLAYLSQLTNFISVSRPQPLRGGLLADDMGLGKSLQVLALLATNRPGVKYSQLKFYSRAEGEGGAAAAAAAADEEGEGRARKRRRKGKEGSEKGEQRAAPKTKVAQQAAEAERLAAEAEAPPTLPSPSGPRGTLIVCPLSVLSGWEVQLEEHTQGGLKVYVYHGSSRDRRPSFLEQQDVVLTTYSTLAADAGLKNGLLKVSWLRVVLDEAHTIKNSATQTARAAQALNAERRWAVTGTPIQNSLKDLQGLMAFLRLEPLHDRSLFMRSIERPIKNRDPTGVKRLQVLMAGVALRRTKDLRVGGRPLVALPPKRVHLVTVRLGREERLKYERWEEAGQRIVSRHLSSNTLLSNYTAVLEIILRLRQICDHCALCPLEDPFFAAEEAGAGGCGKGLTPEVAEKLVQLLKAGLDDDCPICLCSLSDPCITACRHIFCRRCIDMVMVRDKPRCPMCRAPVSRDSLLEIPEDPVESSQQPGDATSKALASEGGGRVSSKMAELLRRLKAAAGGEGDEGGNLPVKSVVFSQFTSMLDLLEPCLVAEGLSYVRLDGSTSAKKRRELLRSFHSQAAGSPQVLIASLKAGGVGLNLTAASHVHLLDPWWNPSVEDQAMDRVHRLGQTRAVEVFRYAAEDSIEERMIQLQQQKRGLMKAAFERRRGEEVRQMRINDVRLLMQL